MNQLSFDCKLPNEGVANLLAMRAKIDALLKYQLDIAEALLYGNGSHSFNDVAFMVMSNAVDMYTFPNSVIIMELTKYPNHSVYHGFIAAGNLQEILDAHPLIEVEAKKRGAKFLTIAGRPGWMRPMRKHGWVHNLAIMSKELT